MTEKRSDKGQEVKKRPKGPVHCRRLDRVLPVGEHENCPYCYGKTDEIQSGEHGQFCDFKPGEDPVSFGFPETHGHYAWSTPPKEAPKKAAPKKKKKQD